MRWRDGGGGRTPKNNSPARKLVSCGAFIGNLSAVRKRSEREAGAGGTCDGEGANDTMGKGLQAIT